MFHKWKNNLAKIFKNLDTNNFVLNHQNNYTQRLNVDDNAAKN